MLIGIRVIQLIPPATRCSVYGHGRLPSDSRRYPRACPWNPAVPWNLMNDLQLRIPVGIICVKFDGQKALFALDAAHLVIGRQREDG